MTKGKSKAPSKQRKFPIILPVAGVIAFLACIGNGFVNLDDPFLITNNPKVISPGFSDIGQIFSFQLGTANYKPVVIIVYKFVYSLFGENPAAFHGISVLLHILNSVLLFKILEKVFPRLDKGLHLLLPLGAALIWAVHPFKVESVAWASELEDILSGFFFLSGWFLLEQKRHKNGSIPVRAWLIGSGLFLVAFLCKASILSAFLFPFYPFILSLGKPESRKRLSIIMVAGILVWLGIFIFSGDSLSLVGGADLNHSVLKKLPLPLAASITALMRIGGYLLHFLLPVKLAVIYPFELIAKNTTWVLPLFTLAGGGLITSLFFLYKKSKIIHTGAFLFLSGILPFLFISIQGTNFLSDRYLYIPSIGLCITLMGIFQIFWGAKGKTLNYLIYGITVILMFSSLARIMVWKNSETLFTDLINKYPEFALAYNNRGLYYQEVGKKTAALKEYEKAIGMNPENPQPFMNRATLKIEEGDLQTALNDYNQALSIQPESYEALGARGSVYARMGKLAEAEADFLKALSISEFSIDALLNLGKLNMDRGDFKEAADYYQKYLNFYPENAKIQYVKGFLEEKLGNPSTCIHHLDISLGINPSDGEVYMARSRCHSLNGNKGAALQDARKAQSLGFRVDPNFLRSLETGN